jgi:hypothetical protein
MTIAATRNDGCAQANKRDGCEYGVDESQEFTASDPIE